MNQAWIVAVDMGYGHQRAAYPLRNLSPTGKVILANNYEGIPKHDQQLWTNSRKIYELISRFKNVPIVGDRVFDLMDYWQKIPDFYPRRDLSKPNIQLRAIYKWLRKKKWGKNLIDFLSRKNGHKPFVSTFFIPAFMAEEHGYMGEIYCVICDADCSRTWAPLDPRKSRIKYFAPCRRVVERLQLYGVKKENIFLTGFPLPKENLGGKNLKLLKKDLVQRVLNLDPCGHYRQKYRGVIQQFLKNQKSTACNNGIGRALSPTITFAVGGAGAQKKLAAKILTSLKEKILQNKIRLNLVAGSRIDVCLFFKQQIDANGLAKRLNKNLKIIFAAQKEDYFASLNQTLRTTDILWTKPSELVFYAALGLPIIIAPSVGSQEDFNRTWLKTINAGISQADPELTHEWLFDWINSGWLAEAAMSGYLDERQFGTYSIEDVLFKGSQEPTKNYQLL